jgi:APA family basic amino acid/polyamine antiporter
MFIFGQQSKLEPDLNFWQLFFMAVSGTLGAGLFVLLGQAAGIAGYQLPLSFVAAGFSAFLLSQIYAELATAMPAAGGGQVYVRTAFSHHPLLFVIHFLTWLAELAFTAINALGLGSYLSLILPLPPLTISVAALALLMLINLKGVKNVGKIETYIGLGLLLALAAIIILLAMDLPFIELLSNPALTRLIPTQFIPGLKNLSSGQVNFAAHNWQRWGWLQAVPMVYLVFVGNEDIAAIVEEVKNKNQNVPKALMLSISAITLITMVLSFLFLAVFSLSTVAGNQQPFALLATNYGQLGQILGLAIAIFACISSLFYGSLADTRTAFALSEAGELPRFFAKVNRNQVPAGSIIANTGLALLLVLTNSAALVANIANIGLFLEAIFVSWALIKLRKKRPHLPRPYLAKPFPLIPILVIIFNFIFLATVQIQAWAITLLVSAIALSAYLILQANLQRKSLGLMGVLVGLLLTVIGVGFFLSHQQAIYHLLMIFLT